MSFVDPNQFIITRKRKKYKFALFHNSPLCFEFDEWIKRGSRLFGNRCWNWIIQRGACAAPSWKDVFSNWRERWSVAEGRENCWRKRAGEYVFVRARADQIDQLVEQNSLEQIWVTFPDPFPRKHSTGRRLTHPNFLKKYSSLLKSDGSLLIKHDDHNFFCWSLEQLVAEKWQIKELSFWSPWICAKWRI